MLDVGVADTALWTDPEPRAPSPKPQTLESRLEPRVRSLSPRVSLEP
jgi:hypothetical protein